MRFEGWFMLMWFRKILPTVVLASGVAQAAYSLDPSVALADEAEATRAPRPVAQDTQRYDSSAPVTRAPQPRREEPAPKPVVLNAADTAQVKQMLQSLDRSAFFVNTVTARMNVTIKRGGSKAMTLDGVYMGDANGNLRLRLTGMFGILAMDVIIKDGQLTCWMPTKKLLVQATREELLEDAHSELAVLAAVGQARELFFPRPWADGATQRRMYSGDSEVRIGVFGGASGRSCLRDYALDTAENAIRSLDVLTERGETIGRVDYAQYQALTKVDSRDDKEKEGDWRSAFKVPRSLKLADGQGRMTLECALESLRVNEPLKSDAFSMDMPKGVPPQSAKALEQAAREIAGVAAQDK